MRRIENDEQYFKSLDWLVEKAQELDHPLMDPESKAELLAKYDFVAAGVIEYQQRKPEQIQVTEPDPPKKEVNLSDWLDD